ncbi:MAG: Gfo/Idh/MocA family oxidoreductase, partial [Patescibacteria group bacterium]|nr:Gfo/Idh/MocA family oxidoreductase [Patescibacteria group bacterium]
MNQRQPKSSARRQFLGEIGGITAALGAGLFGVGRAYGEEPKIPGFEQAKTFKADRPWEPVSERKIRVGIVGYGVCRFGAQFGFQDHPNVEVVAVSDLDAERCATLAKVVRCEKTYPSLEELVKDDAVEAVFVATDAPSHARHCLEALKHGKHVAVAVPAVFGDSLEEADQLLEAVKTSGLTYMMFETSCFHEELYAMRQIYRSGGFGEIVYSEGEYYHYMATPIDSFRGWRVGLPPLWYPTHSTAYQIGVTGGSFTEVSCMGMPSIVPHLTPENNRYKNPFGTEIALFRTSAGGMSRMTCSWDTPGLGGEKGRVRGQLGSMDGMSFQGLTKEFPSLARPPLPPSVAAGGHGGSHGPLCNEFVLAILQQRKPLVD